MDRYRFDSLLATTDLTEASDESLRSAAAIRDLTGASVHVFHCVKRPGPFGPGSGESEARRLDAAERALDEQIRRALDGSPPASRQVGVGVPAAAISERAARVGAGLITLGPHRPRGRFDSLLGTTADRVVRTAAVPCLLAHKPFRPPLRRAVVGTDFSEPARRALELAVDLLTGPLGARGPRRPAPVLEIVCVAAFEEPAPPMLAVEPRLEAEAAHARTRAEAGPFVVVRTRILSAPLVVDGIRQVVDEVRPGLLILGTHGFGPVTRLLLGGVASAVARLVRHPLLLVPPPPG